MEIITIIIMMIGFIISWITEVGKIWSPIGLLIVTIGFVLFIAPAFEEGSLQGWVMVGASLFFLYFTFKAYQLYDILKKDD